MWPLSGLSDLLVLPDLSSSAASDPAPALILLGNRRRLVHNCTYRQYHTECYKPNYL